MFKKFGFVFFNFLLSYAFAATPTFILTPLSFTPPKRNLFPIQIAPVIYVVKNNSPVTRTMTMKPIGAVVQYLQPIEQLKSQFNNYNVCGKIFTLAPQQLCYLQLAISGRSVQAAGKKTILGGPQICKTKSLRDISPDPLYCVQPAKSDILNLTLTSNDIPTLIVSPSSVHMEPNVDDTTTYNVNVSVFNNAKKTTAYNVSAKLSGSSLENNLIQNSSACKILAPQQSCLLNFISKNIAVSGTVPVQGGPDDLSIDAANTYPTSLNISIGDQSLTTSPNPLMLTVDSSTAGEVTFSNPSANSYTSVSVDETILSAKGITYDLSTCASGLGANSQCKIAFTPGSVQVTNLAVPTTFQSTNGLAQVNAYLSVVPPGAASISVAPDFLNLMVNGSAQTLSVTNQSSSTIESIQVDLGNLKGKVLVDTGSCLSLAPNASCPIYFTPLSELANSVKVAIYGKNTTIAYASIAILAPKPFPTSVTPNKGSISGGQVVVISGGELQNTSAVNFKIGNTTYSGTDVSATVDGKKVYVTTPEAPQGVATIILYSAYSTSQLDNAYTFSPMTVESFSPNFGPTTGTTQVNISGIGFVSGATVKFGSLTSNPVIYQSSSLLTATSPAGTQNANVQITVTNPDGAQSTTTSSFYFTDTYIANSISPEQTSADSPVSSATIYGYNLGVVTSVSFNCSVLSQPSIISKGGNYLQFTVPKPGSASLYTSCNIKLNGASTSLYFKYQPTY